LIFSSQKPRAQRDLVALHCHSDGLAIAASSVQQGKRTLSYCDFLQGQQFDSQTQAITRLLQKQRLTGSDCSLVLSPGEYQLLMTEEPDLPEQDWCEALRWRVKDLVSCDIETAQLDYIKLPEDAYAGRDRKLYVFIADGELINQRLDWLDKLGLNPDVIDVPESALLNLCQGHCSMEPATAVLLLDQQQSWLTLLSQDLLYLSRSLQYNYQTRPDAVALDLQRSMDYHESQIGKPPCSQVLVLPEQPEQGLLLEALRSQIAADIRSEDINRLIASNSPISAEHQQRCMLAIGAALRERED